jgi:hypothetical protein
MLGHVFRRRREAADRARQRRRELIQQVVDEETATADADTIEARTFAASVQPKTFGRWYCMWSPSTGLYYAFFQGVGSERGICLNASTPDELWDLINEKDDELLWRRLPAWRRSDAYAP